MKFLYITLVILFSSPTEATELYVLPSGSPISTCPGQPCQSLAQYTESLPFYGSDTVFKFLPGTHYVSNPLVFANAHNVSVIGSPTTFESEWPVLRIHSLFCPDCKENDESQCVF